MRQPWHQLLLRARSRSWARLPVHPSHSQVQSESNLQSFRFLTSLLHNHSIHDDKISPSLVPTAFVPRFFANTINPTNPSIFSRSFSSEQAFELKDSDHAIISDIFSKHRGVDDIRKDLELNNIVISHELILSVLGKLDSCPNVARRFFDWVLESDGERLSSKSYNLMLGILGVNGLMQEFWDLVHMMKKKGYGVSKGVRDRVLEKFEKEGMDGDVEKLRGVFALGSIDNSSEKICSRMSKIIRNEVWGDDVEKQLQDLNVTFSSDLVKLVLDSLGTEPTKALIFFRWLDENGLFRHDQQTYNAVAQVLGREDCIDRFWKVVDEMRSKGYDMEVEVYAKVLGRFCKRKMLKDAVDLYEYAMAGANKPSVHCCTFLLKKIVVDKKLDMGLFYRVVRIFTESGNALTNSMLDSVLKSLNSVGRYGECSKVLKAMEEGGYVVSNNLQSKIAFQLGSAGKKDEAIEIVDGMEVFGSSSKTWASLIEGLCVAGDLDKASSCLQKMVEKEGANSAGYAFDSLVIAYCRKNKAMDAYKLLNELVSEKQLKPWHSTYKVLISKLLVEGGFGYALNILEMMKNHGFPPFVDPFVEYVSKSGTGDDAVAFLKAMTSKRFPSISVVLRVFEAYFKAGRHTEAQDFLSKCPGYIRNHADVLNLFCSMNTVKG
ncbi:pentatricopeptide repeat-containing protein At3g02490, mitochondrial [Ziziphus jujuba]|uniref:Pentatricopeptide repeat-containing protein At3g02490, mitochondrial n=1 Tax=Ziziphus jujuba TaxID=326968 RepID=A0A6P3ZK68_ZIZJJ|nr:pentatricopeptide repeat-containing protein At3g02490, mitochondrial [Ziziphus jujuba]